MTGSVGPARRRRLFRILALVFPLAALLSAELLLRLRPAFWGDLREARAQELFFDHCHPTALGHSMIADLALPRILGLLR